MRESRIEVKAFAVLLNSARTHHLVWRGVDETKEPPIFHRLLGGHVEFDEDAESAIVRELAEECGRSLSAPKLLGVVENRFVYRGEHGHEVVFVFTGEMDAETLVDENGGWLEDNGQPILVEWRPALSDGLVPLYPDGVQSLVETAARNA